MRPKKPWKPLGFSKTVASEFLSDEPLPEPSRRARNGNRGGRPRILKRVDVEEARPELGTVVALRPVSAVRPIGVRPTKSPSMAALVREWLAELKVMNRSPQTIEWYQQKMEWYLQHEGGPATLDGLTSAEVKRLLGALMDRGLAPNTVHGFFQVIRALANWALREGYPVDPAIVKMRPPKVPIAELETFTAAQQEAMVNAANPGWARLAVQILLGTGMRCGELAALSVSDFEDDGGRLPQGPPRQRRQVSPGAALQPSTPGGRALPQPPPDRVRERPATAPERRRAGPHDDRRVPAPADQGSGRLQVPRSQVPPHLRHRVPTQRRRHRAPAPNPRPLQLRDGHALPAPGQGRPGQRLRPAYSFLRRFPQAPCSTMSLTCRWYTS